MLFQEQLVFLVRIDRAQQQSTSSLSKVRTQHVPDHAEGCRGDITLDKTWGREIADEEHCLNVPKTNTRKKSAWG